MRPRGWGPSDKPSPSYWFTPPKALSLRLPLTRAGDGENCVEGGERGNKGKRRAEIISTLYHGPSMGPR